MPRRIFQVKTSIEHELGQPLESYFSSVDPFPLASATIAQVREQNLWWGTTIQQHSSAYDPGAFMCR